MSKVYRFVAKDYLHTYFFYYCFMTILITPLITSHISPPFLHIFLLSIPLTSLLFVASQISLDFQYSSIIVEKGSLNSE